MGAKQKLLTALRLLGNGSWSSFRSRLRINLRRRWLARAGKTPFVYSIRGFRFVCTPGIADSEESFLTSEVDELELGLLRRWLEPGDVFVDLGANLGLYTFCAHHHLGGQGTFLAVEASAELARNFTTSATLLGIDNVMLVNEALGDRMGEATFYIAPPGKSTGIQSLIPDPAHFGDYLPHTVQMRTLTDIVRRHSAAARPSAVKLDIEGAETLALAGAPAEWFQASGPLWIVEVCPDALARAGSTPASVVEFFPGQSFDRWLLPQFAINGPRNLPARPLTPGESFSDAWFYNLIAIPRDRIDAARAHRVVAALSQHCTA